MCTYLVVFSPLRSSRFNESTVFFLLFQCDFSIPFSIVSKVPFYLIVIRSIFYALYNPNGFRCMFARPSRAESMFKAFERCCLHKSMYTVLYIHRSYFSSLSRDKNVVLVLSLSNDRTRDERTFKRRTFYECIIISGKSIETRFTFMVFHLCSSFGRASALKENRFSRTLAHIGIFVIQMQTTKVQPTQAIVSFFSLSDHTRSLFPCIYCWLLKRRYAFSIHTEMKKKKAYTQNIMQETQICGKNFIIRTSNKNRLINGLETCTIIVLSLFLECSFSFIIICGPKKMHSHTHTRTAPTTAHGTVENFEQEILNAMEKFGISIEHRMRLFGS